LAKTERRGRKDVETARNRETKAERWTREQIERSSGIESCDGTRTVRTGIIATKAERRGRENAERERNGKTVTEGRRRKESQREREREAGSAWIGAGEAEMKG